MKTIARLGCALSLIWMLSAVYAQSQFPERLPHQAVSVRWSAQGDLYATGHVDGSVRIYDNTGLSRIISNAHNAPIFGLAFSPDGSRLATGGYDNNVRIWNTSSDALLAEFIDLGDYIGTLSWSSNGTTIFATSINGTAHVISANISTDSYMLSGQLSVGLSFDTAWDHEDSLIGIGLPATDIRLVDTSNYTILRNLDATPDVDILQPPNEFTTSVTWHPSANIVANGKINGWIHVWDLDSPSDTIPVLSLPANDGATDDALIPFEYRVIDIAFSADGSILNSISSDGTIRMWDAETGELLSGTNVGETILAGAFSPGSGTLVYSTYSQVDEPLRVIQFPTADAGADQTLTADGSGFATVTLDGSASFDPDGEIVSYVWTLDDVEIATDAVAQVQLGVGVHEVALIVTDDDGAVGVDSVVVTVD